MYMFRVEKYNIDTLGELHLFKDDPISVYIISYVHMYSNRGSDL